MIILGLNTFGEGPSACLLRDGQLCAFAQEERFTRLKGSAGMFPAQAVSWCLSSQSLRLGDVDRISVAWDCSKYPWKMLRTLARMKLAIRSPRGGSVSHPQGGSDVIPAALYLLNHAPGTFERGIRDALHTSGHKGPIPPIAFIEHHRAHALQSFLQSPFDEAAVLVVDGSGEEAAVSAYAARGRSLRPLFRYDVPQSLGWYYSAFTAYLGFRPNRDEGKLMGLAALGECRRGSNDWIERLEQVLHVTAEGFELDASYVKSGGNEHHPRFTDRLVRFIMSYDDELGPVMVNERVRDGDNIRNKYLSGPYVDLAYAVQDRLEAAYVGLARRAVREAGCSDLCLAGGVAMNCKANGCIQDALEVRRLFVHPASSDDGSALGAAFAVAIEEGEDPRNELRHVQWGPAFSVAEIEEILGVCGLTYSTPADVPASAARLLREGKIVGWFHGGAEMGARALGGRSIVAWARDPDTKQRLNSRVKFREEWRPYCPSLPWDESERMIAGGGESPFMIVARSATDTLLATAPGTVHVDRTIRPQTVRPETLPRWYQLLECVRRETGDPVLLNTSLNIRGEPMACTPLDAVRCYAASGLDALVLEDFLLVK